MLTPRFKLQQDETRVYITVHAPYTNIGETEIDIDGENFLFVSSPYFLRLRLPGKIVENDSSKGSYTCDSGDFNLTFDKENPGEHFENLDMITSLLAPRHIPDLNPNLVEMLEEGGITIDEENDENEVDKKYSYGFASKISTEFKEIGMEFPKIFELKWPEQHPIGKRNSLREQYEFIKFSSDHYLADLHCDELVAPYLFATVFWASPDFDKDADFTEEEVSLLKDLPNKHYILTKTEHRQVFLGLVDILYGYCYDKRTTLNESTVESSWTINKLSATLSWFCVFKDIKEVLKACYRRALVYPILRNFEICHKVKNDLISLLKHGKKFIIKCVIDIYQMFNQSDDARYILNQIYMKDYLIFLQQCSQDEFIPLCDNIANTEITKKDVELELEELEAAAEMVQQEEIQILENEMAVKMASMSLIPGLNKLNDANNLNNALESDSSASSSDSSDSETDESEFWDSDDDRS
ncbi:protein SHQ1 homolog [Vanessa atalanta]|uniref:protein SHQ1 homolog n=1 Tax=Vanessa atalanta TaxID=42275 RepID=UPI001FCCF70D|nr:protein SHQ1 homolog [Vanessa atalanta]